MYTKIIRLILLLSVLLLISACASLSESECNSGAWAEIGKKDASKGYLAAKQLSKHRSACAKYQKVPNVKLYNSGYAQGLKLFCRNPIGFKHGSNKNEYYGNCPTYLEREFLSGYIPGLESAIDSLADDIDDLRFKRSSVNRRLDSTSNSDRNNKKHKKKIKRLERRLSSLRSSIYSKRSDISKLRSWRSRWLYKLDKG